MMRTRCSGTLLLILGLGGASLDAQIRPDIFGYQVRGLAGTAGEFCHVFDCTPRPLFASAGETLTLQVNAPFQALYAIAASFTATNCAPLPLVANMLVLNAPIVTLVVGVVGSPSPILACWDGTVSVPLLIPTGLPQGLAFATQAVAEVPTLSGVPGPSFSVAVVTTLR